jgi:phospholipid transport system substrate-binding protein
MKLITLVFLLASVPAFAGPATDAVKTANTTISQLVQNKAPAAQVTASVNNFLDIDELGKRAMGNNWGKLTPAQQKQFLQELHALIEANYIAGVNNNLSYQVSYNGESTNAAGNPVVSTTIHAQHNGRPVNINVDYVLEKTGNGYRAFDIMTDGVGLVDNYQQQFNTIIQKYGVNGLIQKMQKKQSQLSPASPSATQTNP